MAIMTFDDDTITGLLDNGSTTTITTGTAPYTFNPFAGVTVTDAAGPDAVTMRLTLSDLAGGTFPANTNGATLHFVSAGTSLTMVQGDPSFTMAGTSAQVQTWMTSMYIVAYSLNDLFRFTLRGFTEAGAVTGFNYLIDYTIACYLQGTMIGTPAGERSVESLQAGDHVTTLDGSAKKVKWIGHRTYEAEFGAAEAFVRPVLIRAGALGRNLPTRDLKVSPQHGMMIDGVMVPAAALVNGVSIVRDTAKADVTYFHIEMDGHEAIFAEGAASETFVDHASRALFDNADEYNLMYGNSAASVQELARVEEGTRLAAIRSRLAEIAGILTVPAAGAMMGNFERIENGVLHGWVIDSVGADAVEADVLVDGAPVARMIANRYRTDLDQEGLAGGIGGFTVALPDAATTLEQVSLRRVVDGQKFAAPALATAAG